MRKDRILGAALFTGMLLGGTLLSGCGDVAYQTRFIPTAEEIGYTSETHELPWQPPAVGGVGHDPRPKVDPDSRGMLMRPRAEPLGGMAVSE